MFMIRGAMQRHGVSLVPASSPSGHFLAQVASHHHPPQPPSSSGCSSTEQPGDSRPNSTPPNTSPIPRGHGATYTDHGTPVHRTPRNTGSQIQLVGSQAQNLYFWLFLFFPLLFSSFLPYVACLLFTSLQRTSNLHFSLALYIIRPDYNRPGFKCIITTVTVITIKHSFNGNKKKLLQKK